MFMQATNKVNVKQLKSGSVVVVRSGFGSEAPETVTVDDIESDCKNGRATIDYVDCSDRSRWAYTDQIVKVVSY